MRAAKTSTQRGFLAGLAAFGMLAVGGMLWAQGRGGQAPAALPNIATDPALQGFEFRSIGPATMMGRLDTIMGADDDSFLMYIGFATGGLWKSTDGGYHWKSQFDEHANESIGDIAIAPSNHDVVYVGMGEPNNRQSSSIGDGMWGTRDGGQTWTHLGLPEDVQSIGRVAVDPTNPDIVFVAALGHLFGPNKDRGLYKSTDGGQHFKLAKYIDENTGFSDVAIDPSNAKTIYASSYMRRRTWWGFNGGGANSALWKLTDGGDTWTNLNGPGWPKPKDGIYGRIAIAVYHKNPQVLYVQVEAGASGGTGAGTGATGGPCPAGGGRGAGGDPGCSNNAEAGAMGPTAGGAGRGARGGGGGGGAAAAGGPPAAGAAGAAGPGGRGGRGETPPDPNGSGVFRSDDGGKTWAFQSQENQRPVYFSQIRVDPSNDQKLLVGGNPGRMSLDGGKTWTSLTGSHTDYHALWISVKDPRIVAVGHDGGLDISHDGGFTFEYQNNMAVGQFYQVSADNRHPYWVCGGLQDNNAWCGPSANRSNVGPVNTQWFVTSGGDGFYTRQDPTDWATVYGESQDGAMERLDLRAGTSRSIQPRAAGGRGGGAPAAATPPAGSGDTTNANEAQRANAATNSGTQGPEAAAGRGAGQAAAATAPAAAAGGGGRGGASNVVNAPPNLDRFRFYWNAPFEISPWNPAVVYMGAQYFFKSNNRGDSWWMNPTDLTKHEDRWAPNMAIMGVAGDKPMAEKHDGYSSSSLITQVRESPARPGVIWIGTDDGNLQVSQDDGVSFVNVYSNIAGAPKGEVQIERIEPSHFDAGTAYVALDAHRNSDDWRPYIFKTTNFGRSWVNVTGDLPQLGNVEGFREDIENPNLLFVGTEFGLYVSLDGGKSYKKFMTGLPSVRVDDILIHPRDRDLILATHGRSIWIADDITPLEQMNRIGANQDLYLFDPRPAVQWKNNYMDPHSDDMFQGQYRGQNPQGGTAISVWAKSDLGDAKLEFLNNGQVIRNMDITLKAGLNRVQWDMHENPAPQGAAGGGRRGAFQGADTGAAAPAAAGQTAAPGRGAQAPAAAAPAAGGGGGGRGGGRGGVPFVASSRGGGGGGFGGGGGGNLVAPGTYEVRLLVGNRPALTTSVTVLEDIWMPESK